MGLLYTNEKERTQIFSRDLGTTYNYQQAKATIPVPVIDISRIEYGISLIGLTTDQQAKDSYMSFVYELNSFKIKRIYAWIVESPNVAGACMWSGNVLHKNSYLSMGLGMNSDNSLDINNYDITGLLLDTIINGSLNIEFVGTASGTAGLCWLTIEGIQL